MLICISIVGELSLKDYFHVTFYIHIQLSVIIFVASCKTISRLTVLRCRSYLQSMVFDGKGGGRKMEGASGQKYSPAANFS